MSKTERLMREMYGAIDEELAAAGPDEMKQHPMHQSKARLLARAKRHLATMRPDPTPAILRGVAAACHVSLAAFEAASDGSGDVSVADARDIKRALEWATGEKR